VSAKSMLRFWSYLDIFGTGFSVRLETLPDVALMSTEVEHGTGVHTQSTLDIYHNILDDTVDVINASVYRLI